jgi:hypothetical protein
MKPDVKCSSRENNLKRESIEYITSLQPGAFLG